MKRTLWVLVLVGSVLLSAAPLLADGDFYVVAGGGGVGTKITSLPYTINSPGFYYLGGNFTLTQGNGITVNANNVTIDLMGFCLNGENSDSSAIFINNLACEVEIRNGALTAWNYAVSANSPQAVDVRVTNIRALGNKNGIVLEGVMHIVKGCQIYNYPPNIGGIGISIGGGIIRDNLLRNCNTGIALTGNNGGSIINNFIFLCNTNISVNYAGNIIGNFVSCNTGQTGIAGTSLTMIDQNTVSGPGTHSTGISTAALGTNKGLP
jgi:hypothetical protein